MKPLGIYIHVPFCARKCPYCDFYSCSYNSADARAYTNGIVRDIDNFKGSAVADTIYFGGGTPSLLPAELIGEIISALKRKFIVTDPEVTIEVNPCTVTENKLGSYLEMGIDRLSVGVQSANDNELTLLGRNHTFEKARETINTALECGFENISCDLMIGLPGQTKESLRYSVESLAALPVKHISSYILKIEDGTPFDNEEMKEKMPDDDFISDMYLYMVDMFLEHGFEQYEISNFSKPGFESRHNLKYWQCREYVGFGPSAHSYFNGSRYCFSSNLKSFIKSTPKKIITDDSPGSDEEKIMLGLRLSAGITPDDFPDRKSVILRRGEALEKAGLVTLKNGTLSLTPRGFLVSNSIINELTL